MKFPWLAVFVVAAFACLALTRASSDEPGESPTSTAGPIIGKEPGQVRDDNALKMKLVWCPPGEFTMGSPPAETGRGTDENQVSVSLTKGFWLGKFEVTQAEWKLVMKTEPWKAPLHTRERSDFPAIYVNWMNVAAFCSKFTDDERGAGRLPEGWRYTLPTEAEWEYACRAETTTKFSFGDDGSKLGEYAWYDENLSDYGVGDGHCVGQKKPNPWGLHDMHGNVWEWCRDSYSRKPPGGRDPLVRSNGLFFVIRGGGRNNDALDCRSASRRYVEFHLRNDPDVAFRLGFRLALSSDRPPE
jgi:formylglycine-generating enzyme required for sulfatase activity